MNQVQETARGTHQSLREATAFLLHQGKVEELLELSLDYIFSMLSQHSDRLNKLEQSRESLNLRIRRHMTELNQGVHEITSQFEGALATKCEEIHALYETAAEERVATMSAAAQEETWTTTTKKGKSRRARKSANERREVISSAEQGVSQVDATSNDGIMSLDVAIQKGQLGTVRHLVMKSGTEVEYGGLCRTPLLIAAECGTLDILQYLVFEASADCEATNRVGNNALGVAAFYGQSDALRLLWTATGKGLERPDEFGMTPLLVAAGAGHVEAVKYLLDDAGANCEAADKHGRGMLAVASNCGHFEVVKFLMTQVGADIGRTNNAGMTPLLEASSKGHLLIVKYFLSGGMASIDESCSLGGTCLHHAAAQGRLKLIQYLCSKTDANVSANDRNGLKPCHWASSALSRSLRELKSDSGGVSQAKVDRLKKAAEYLQMNV